MDKSGKCHIGDDRGQPGDRAWRDDFVNTGMSRGGAERYGEVISSDVIALRDPRGTYFFLKIIRQV